MGQAASAGNRGSRLGVSLGKISYSAFLCHEGRQSPLVSKPGDWRATPAGKGSGRAIWWPWKEMVLLADR